MCADNQRQVGLLNELVNSALPITSTTHFISKQLNPRIGDKSHSGEIELVSHGEEEKSLGGLQKLTHMSLPVRRMVLA